jgi:heme/copper-type cytochrome/quinol oxidase subunit 2
VEELPEARPTLAAVAARQVDTHVVTAAIVCGTFVLVLAARVVLRVPYVASPAPAEASSSLLLYGPSAWWCLDSL